MQLSDAERATLLQAEVSTLFGHLARSLAARERAGASLSRGEYSVLKQLIRLGECRAQDVSAAEGSDPSTMSRRIVPLVERGLVARSPDPADGRAALLRITEAGRAALADERERRAAELGAAVADWDSAAVDDLTRLIHDLNDSLDRAWPAGRTGARSTATERSTDE